MKGEVGLDDIKTKGGTFHLVIVKRVAREKMLDHTAPSSADHLPQV